MLDELTQGVGERKFGERVGTFLPNVTARFPVAGAFLSSVTAKWPVSVRWYGLC